MLPEDNAPGSIEDRTLGDVEPAPRTTAPNAVDQRGSQGAAKEGLHAPAKTHKKSIDVVFDLNDPEQAKKLEWHKTAFGEDYVEIEPLGGGKVILKLYPGGATKGLP